MHDDIAKLQQQFENLISFHQEFRSVVLDIAERVKSQRYEKQTLVDLGYLMRETEKLAEETRKNATANKNLIGKVHAFIAIQGADEEGIKNTKGDLATGMPDVTMIPAELPKKDSVEYLELADHLNVPRNALELMKLDWRAVSAYMTQCAEDGKRMPKCFGDARPVYSTTFRKRN